MQNNGRAVRGSTKRLRGSGSTWRTLKIGSFRALTTNIIG